jgi:hypothetical protein
MRNRATVLLLYSIGIGLICGRLAGGRVGNLEHLQLRWWGLALAGLCAQVVLFSTPVAAVVGQAGPPLYVLSTLIVLAVVVRNVRHPGLAIVALGAALNLVAIVSNGGVMPSAPEAWLALNGRAVVPTDDFSNSVLIGPDTLFPWLGDVFVLPRPLPFANVFSIGDVVIGVGAVVFLVIAMRCPASAPPLVTRPASAAPTSVPARQQR